MILTGKVKILYLFKYYSPACALTGAGPTKQDYEIYRKANRKV